MQKAKLPAGFPHRLAFVPGWVGVFQVPRHIVRIDIHEPGLIGTHGWQVRFLKPTKFFSDFVAGRRYSPRTSLALAKQYLAETYAGPRIPFRQTPTARRNNEIQEVGIRLVKHKHNGRAVTEIYVEAMSPIHGVASSRFYVGTENTVTTERLEIAKTRARQKRMELVDEYTRSRLF